MRNSNIKTFPAGLYLLLPTFAFFLLLNSFGPALPQAGAEEFDQYDAHEHGVGQLNMAVEGKALYIELISPAANIVGFEHAPATEQEKNRVKHAIEILKDVNKLFSFPGKAGVSPGSSDIRHAEKAEDHDQHGYAEEEHEGHSDFQAEYDFHIDNPGQLEFVDTFLLQLFPAMEHLEVQVLTPRRQTAMELADYNKRINF